MLALTYLLPLELCIKDLSLEQTSQHKTTPSWPCTLSMTTLLPVPVSECHTVRDQCGCHRVSVGVIEWKVSVPPEVWDLEGEIEEECTRAAA